MVKRFVSVSGGATGTVDLPLEVIKKYPNDEIVLVMAIIKNEHPDTWRMIEWLENKTGIQVQKITYTPKNERETVGKFYKIIDDINEAYDVWDLFFEQKMMGSTMFDICSSKLKRDVLRHYMKDHAKKGDYMHVGITHDEKRRLNAIVANWSRQGIRIKADLVQSLRYETRTKAQRCADAMGFVPELYALDFAHNNCGGGCVKAGKKYWARLLWYFPDVFDWWASNELKFKSMYDKPDEGKYYTILRETVDGERVKLTLADLRTRLYGKWGIRTDENQGVELQMRMFAPFDDFDSDDDYACNLCESVA